MALALTLECYYCNNGCPQYNGFDIEKCKYETHEKALEEANKRMVNYINRLNLE